MKMLGTSEPRSFGCSLKEVLKEGFGELAFLVRRGLSLGVMLFLALTTLSFLNRGAGYLEASAKFSAVGKRSEAVVVAPVARNLVIPRHTAARPSSGYAFQPALAVSTYSPKTARDTLRESGYLINEIDSFARSLARLGR